MVQDVRCRSAVCSIQCARQCSFSFQPIEVLHTVHNAHNYTSDECIMLLQEQPESLKHLQSRSPGLNKLMPMITPFELLQRPLTTHGIGMALKRSILMCPWQTAVYSPYYRMLPIEKMQQMTLFHAHFGRFEDLIFSVCAVELPAEAQRVLESPQRSSPPPSPLRLCPASPEQETAYKPMSSL